MVSNTGSFNSFRHFQDQSSLEMYQGLEFYESDEASSSRSQQNSLETITSRVQYVSIETFSSIPSPLAFASSSNQKDNNRLDDQIKIHQRILNAKNLDEILKICRNQLNSLDAVNLVAIMNRINCIANSREINIPRIEHEFIIKLSKVAREKISEFKTEEIVALAWAFAALKILPSKGLFDAIAQVVIEKLSKPNPHEKDKFEPFEIARLAWSFATLNIQPPVGFFEILGEEAIRRMSEFTIDNSSMLIWAFAIFEIFHEQLFSEVFKKVTQNNKTTVSYQFYHAILRYNLSCQSNLEKQLKLSASFSECPPKNSSEMHMEISGICLRLASNSSYHFVNEVAFEGYFIDIADSSNNIAIEVDGLVHFARRSTDWLGYTLLKDKILSLSGWRVIHIPCWEWHELETMQQKEDYLKSKLTFLFENDQVQINQKILQAGSVEKILEICRDQLPIFNPVNLSTTLSCLAKIVERDGKQDQIDLAVIQDLTAAAMGKISDFKFQQIALLTWGFAVLRIQPPKLFIALARAAIEIIAKGTDEFRSHDLASFIWAFAVLDIRPPTGVWAPFATKAIEMMTAFKFQEIANLTWAFAFFGEFDESLFSKSIEEVGKIGFEIGFDISACCLFYQAILCYNFNYQSNPEKQLKIPESITHLVRHQSPSQNYSEKYKEIYEISQRLGSDFGYHFIHEVTFEGYFIDIADPNNKITIEVDEPSFFAFERPDRRLGYTILKTRILSLSGWNVIRINYLNWNKLKTTQEKEDYLKSRLTSLSDKKPMIEKIAEASSVEEILDICGDQGNSLSGGDLSTALYCIASIIKMNNFQEIDLASINHLVIAVIEKISELKPHNIASLAWAFATLHIQPPKGLFEVFDEAGIKKILEFNPRHISDLAWAIAILNIPIPEGLVKTLVNAAIEKKSKFKAQDIANIVLAFAVLRIPQPVGVLKNFATMAIRMMTIFKFQEIVNLASAFAIVGDFNEGFFSKILEQVEKTRFEKECFNDLSACCLFYQAILCYNLHYNSRSQPKKQLKIPEFIINLVRQQSPSQNYSEMHKEIYRICQRLASNFDYHFMNEIAFEGYFIDIADPNSKIAIELDESSHCGFRSTRMSEHTILKNKILSLSGWRVIHISYTEWDQLKTEQDKEDDLKMRLTSLSGTERTIEKPINQRVLHAGSVEEILEICGDQWNSLDKETLSITLYSIAKNSKKDNLQKANQASIDDLIKITIEKISEMTPRNISSIAWAFATMNIQPPKGLFEVFDEAGIKEILEFEPNDIVNLATAIATLKIPLPEGLIKTLIKAFIEKASEFRPHNIVNLIGAVAILNIPLSEEFFEALGKAFINKILEFKPQNVVDLIKAIATLHIPQSGVFVKDLVKGVIQKISTLKPKHIADLASDFTLFEAYDQKLFSEFLKKTTQFKKLWLDNSSVCHKFYQALLRYNMSWKSDPKKQLKIPEFIEDFVGSKEDPQTLLPQ